MKARGLNARASTIGTHSCRATAREPSAQRRSRCFRKTRTALTRPAFANRAASCRPRGRYKATAEVQTPRLAKRFIRALLDAFRADIDPVACRHLPIHHQTLVVEFVEVLPVRPLRHEIRIRERHAQGVRMRLELADRLARLDQPRLVVVQFPERGEDRTEAFLVARRAADSTVDDEVFLALTDIRVEVVLDHPERRFGEPALARLRDAARRAHRTGAVRSDVVKSRCIACSFDSSNSIEIRPSEAAGKLELRRWMPQRDRRCDRRVHPGPAPEQKARLADVHQ